MAKLPERIVGATGGISGAASVLGSWQICHNICLGLIALLSLIGITIIGMPLAFFTKIAIPMWSVALALLVVLLVMYVKKQCVSKNLLYVNSGFIVAGVPFQPLQQYSIGFWIVGGLLVAFGAGSFVVLKIASKKPKNDSKESKGCCHDK